jgi:hypothetical protein
MMRASAPTKLRRIAYFMKAAPVLSHLRLPTPYVDDVLSL